ncbi:alpha/beta hydrolase [Mycobacterium sp. KBS0706]|uniref:alpha/beta fold hydrolase n=1 Tax=Mycobacterium sp. KBS0706 TaxID=2578109 RepID=UPI00110F8406|nr:alpha/beta hydrolase [Mycobacterium sp. KBS0706]TSD87651.1 alpha/beta hydrolase [Mycobacterium sp. KBS0706]
MRSFRSMLAATAVLALSGPPAFAADPAPTVPASDLTDLQAEFDPMGPAVQALTLPDGRVVHYIDEGEPGWRPVLYASGTGTSARAFGMTEYLRSLRTRLKLRFISVERNGFGDTEFRPGWTTKDYATEVRAVLDHLGIQQTAALAISGGGPYLAEIAAEMPDRLISLHFLAATSGFGPEKKACTMSEAELTGMMKVAQNPEDWWAYPETSPTRKIPGFADRAYEEGARTYFIRGQMGDLRGQVAEYRRYCTEPKADVTKVQVPVYVYQGTADTSVPLDQAQYWQSQFPNLRKARIYEGEGHDVQYRHWDQLLLDVAGHAELTMLCADGRSQAVPEADAQALLAKGAALGICAWR